MQNNIRFHDIAKDTIILFYNVHSWGQPHKPVIFVVVVLFLLCLPLIWKTNNFLVVQTCNLEFFKNDVEVLLGSCWAAVRKTSHLN